MPGARYWLAIRPPHQPDMLVEGTALAAGHSFRAKVDCFIGEKIYRNWEQE